MWQRRIRIAQDPPEENVALDTISTDNSPLHSSAPGTMSIIYHYSTLQEPSRVYCVVH
jgi:hypothetical protein